MNPYETKDIRNVAIIAHSGVGKTSLGEAFLFDAKVTDRLCGVDEGNSVLDYEPEEIKRKTTISSTFHHLPWKKKVINIIDTPGDINFISDTLVSLSVADSAILVIDAVAGVEIQTDLFWRVTQERSLSTLIFINKMDRERADFFAAIKDIEDALNAKLLVVQLPIGSEENFKGVIDLLAQKAYVFSSDGSGKLSREDIPADMQDQVAEYREKMIEVIAEAEDELIEKYLDTGELTEEELMRGLRTGVLKNTFTPVFCGPAILNMGIQPLLDFVADFSPSPLDRPAVTILHTDT
ncbi:MAG TPA: GTP-binding protein, partial [Thermodesulfobacteriota bacterium]|nr:GTP-binding protein [Thermodesulfobacteriota bacterium]